MADRPNLYEGNEGIGNVDSSERPTNKSVSRRTVIRKMAAGTAVLAGVSALPDTWVSPLVEFGSLPAHATTSGAVEALIEELQQGIAESEDSAAADTTSTDDLRGYSNQVTVNNTGAWVSIDKILRDKFVFPKLGPQYGSKLLIVWSDGRELYVPDSTQMVMYGGDDERKYQPGGQYSGNNPDIPTMEVYAAIGTHPDSVTVYY